MRHWDAFIFFPFTFAQGHVDAVLAVVGQITSSGGGDPLAQLTGYGALGLVVLGAVTGKIRFQPEVTALRADMAAMQRQIDTLLEVHQSQVLPALLQSVEALRTSASQAEALSQLVATRPRRPPT